VVTFHKDTFANPEGLVRMMNASRGLMKVQSDHKLVFRGDWDLPEQRLAGVRDLARHLAELAEQAGAGRAPDAKGKAAATG
jgi:transcription-repair coupling factor (superfamily II helicase)